ncbi:hypothetical protein DFH08DRAFT_815039 [Mycena albidolilacea]|uniref:Uncharacterized protein n=1 Tax=Mycena albidolilacea TaxID=1033008 RepID=A0AAD6ZP49_9AGAR|nr:hypothetical protein DFH08DRAFT_815039 [Mycena albidolilacea]
MTGVRTNQPVEPVGKQQKKKRQPVMTAMSTARTYQFLVPGYTCRTSKPHTLGTPNELAGRRSETVRRENLEKKIGTMVAAESFDGMRKDETLREAVRKVSVLGWRARLEVAKAAIISLQLNPHEHTWAWNCGTRSIRAQRSHSRGIAKRGGVNGGATVSPTMRKKPRENIDIGSDGGKKYGISRTPVNITGTLTEQDSKRLSVGHRIWLTGWGHILAVGLATNGWAAEGREGRFEDPAPVLGTISVSVASWSNRIPSSAAPGMNRNATNTGILLMNATL